MCKLVACVWGFTDKDRELSEALAEIKALRLSERAREKAVEEVSRLINILLGHWLLAYDLSLVYWNHILDFLIHSLGVLLLS